MRPYIILIAFIALLNIGCERPFDKDDIGSPNPPPVNAPPVITERDFELSVSESQWSGSKYCGDVVPEKPEDPTPEYRFESSFISDKLTTTGLRGWIHGAVPRYDQYVFTYRKEDPEDFMAFFKAQQFSLVPASRAIAEQFAALNRHDEVTLKGAIFENGSPLVHIKVTSLEIVKPYKNATENAYSFDDRVISGLDEIDVFGMVHAIVHSEMLGWAVVLENKGYVIPVAVDPSNAETASKLYRGDIVNAKLSVVRRNSGPAHFMTKASTLPAIQVVDPMLNCHGLSRVVEGTLAKFDKSPAINTDVYAVRYVDSNGIGRNFTFFPANGVSEDEFVNIFMAISAKAKAAWELSKKDALTIRNFREKASIRVKATGVLNVVSLEQANAQVYIRSADDVSFEVVE